METPKHIQWENSSPCCQKVSLSVGLSAEVEKGVEEKHGVLTKYLIILQWMLITFSFIQI